MSLSEKAGVSLAHSSGLGRNAHIFDDDDIVQLLRTAIEREGSQLAFARRHGLNRSFVNMVVMGKRSPSKPIAKALGLCRVYRRVNRAARSR
jgi:hypothetical protein